MTSRLFDLTGRVALVTGGSRGLGKAMATIFAEAGASIVISSRHESQLQAAAAEIRDKTGARVEYIVADMTRRDDVRQLAATAVDIMGKIDILVNNAGANVPQAIDQNRWPWNHTHASFAVRPLDSRTCSGGSSSMCAAAATYTFG